ncbi:hypothetical protein [Nocardioides flavescens]|uniref:DUF1499 domain-containing protein n=1 Tax=Nocardioides flavescens TaxID=2691959 RepID=A0A6L7F026_9ACTN|nr:hypothetical protein [Nocardioides flavescens]MXG90325.1 hypothetical protein [Nocardioides flavescens]
MELLVVSAGGAVVTLAVTGLLYVVFRDRWGGQRSSGRVATTTPPDRVLEAAVAIGRQRLKASVVEERRGRVQLKIPVTWRSWGERVEVHACSAPEGSGWTEVEVTSRSRLRTTVLDWGENRANVETLLAGIDALGEV